MWGRRRTRQAGNFLEFLAVASTARQTLFQFSGGVSVSAELFDTASTTQHPIHVIALQLPFEHRQIPPYYLQPEVRKAMLSNALGCFTFSLPPFLCSFAVGREYLKVEALANMEGTTSGFRYCNLSFLGAALLAPSTETTAQPEGLGSRQAPYLSSTQAKPSSVPPICQQNSRSAAHLILTRRKRRESEPTSRCHFSLNLAKCTAACMR
jgi:hypothetical protein